MGFFSRKPPSPPIPPISAYIGRRFRSELAVEACLTNFRTAAAQAFPISGAERSPAWSAELGAGSPTAQGRPAESPPVHVLEQPLQHGGSVHIAIWNGVVSYGSPGASTQGPPCEMWVVYSGFDTNTPTPLAGIWKGLDNSLSSIGWVERDFWGLP